MRDLTIIYYTSNYLKETNPVFNENVKLQLFIAGNDIPLIAVSQKPLDFVWGNNVEYENVVVGNIGRSHLNIYRQILEGCKRAKTEYVAMAEDDILYSYEHFHSELPRGNYFLYDMNKLSLFTWIKPALFTFRHDRMVVNQLIAPRKYLIEALEERFARVEELRKKGWEEKKIIKYFGDPGRYEALLGVSTRKTDTFMCTCPSIVFSHEHAFGYLNQGKKKRLGDLRILEVPYWGRAEEVLKLFYDKG